MSANTKSNIEQFPVSLDFLCAVSGVSMTEAKRMLKKNFVEGVDYIVKTSSPQQSEQKTKEANCNSSTTQK